MRVCKILFVSDSNFLTDANVIVIVSDMDKAIQFYTKILGLKLISRSTTGFDFAVVQAPGLTIGLNPPQCGLQPGKCESLSIEFKVDDLENSMEELKLKE
jgi:catechol 2,3-dioxygenase-like lactoylglutathione lyase family enzyme